MIEITNLQLLWLTSRGGRNFTDVIEMGGQLFVAMRSCGTWKPIMIPSDRWILKEYHEVFLTPSRQPNKTKSPTVLRGRQRPLGK